VTTVKEQEILSTTYRAFNARDIPNNEGSRSRGDE
jgi:hypothetical protein